MQNSLEKPIATIVQFLNSININVAEKELPKDCFLPGLSALGITVLIDPKQLKYPGDILHEAGHIAVTETKTRPLIGTKEMEATWPTDGEEIAAILWSFSACMHLQLPLVVVFHRNGYKGSSDWLIDQFTNKNYIGLPLLEWMGLCTKKEFPRMEKWLR
ncbi:MAG: hypothetical protein JKY44_06325 [Flavobacteriaceae bacterium]|nr:hypothetical protein [Flavobacteriaceae bacterium]